MKLFKYFLIILVLLGLPACAGVLEQSIPEPGSPEAGVYRQKCSSCHGLPDPGRHNVEEWIHFLGLMEGFMKERNFPFPPEEKEAIQSYLFRNARK
mgnify:FL=1